VYASRRFPKHPPRGAESCLKNAGYSSVRKDKAIVLGALILVCVLAWAYLLYMSWGMSHMDVGAAMTLMPRMVSWQAVDLALVFAMWTIMMTAMMLPSAAPTILLFAAVSRSRARPGTVLQTAAFVTGYLAIWTAFSLVATLAQWGLLEARLVLPSMEARSPSIGGSLLIAAGAFQLTPLKQVCLSNCRSPVAFIMTEWRKGARGAFVMGVRHGLYCLGCCWLLMLLLFVLGVMNVLWIALLCVLILGEKTLPNGHWLSRASGILFIVWGLALLVGVRWPPAA
jgi:predicted metal-binding membrane protein